MANVLTIMLIFDPFVLLEQRKVHGQCEDDVETPTTITDDSKLCVPYDSNLKHI
jgi:hypothetical protein